MGWAIDIGVSGAVSPFDAPELSQWLTDDPPEDWDIMAAWMMSRFSRKVIHSYKLLQWCKERGKNLKATDDQIDPMSRVGELIFLIVAWLAEGELEEITKRNIDGYHKLKRMGLFAGGRIPYGFKKLQIEMEDKEGKIQKHWMLEKDEYSAAIRVRIARWRLEGWGRTDIAKRLTEEGELTPLEYNHGKKKRKRVKSSEWDPSAIDQLCTGRALIGQYAINGEIVLDGKGVPVQFAEPLIDYDEWEELQALIAEERQNNEQAPAEKSKYPEIIKCGVCDEVFWKRTQRTTKKGVLYETDYYACCSRDKKGVEYCGNLAVRREDVDATLEEQILNEIGDLPYQEMTIHRASNVSQELAQAKASMTQIANSFGGLKSDFAIQLAQNQLEELDRRIVELSAQEGQGRRIEWREVAGMTYRQHWGTLSVEEKQLALRKAGTKIYVLNWGGDISATGARPGWLAAKMGDLNIALEPKGDRKGPQWRAKRDPIFYVELGELKHYLGNRQNK